MRLCRSRAWAHTHVASPCCRGRVLPRTVSAELKSKLSYMSTEVERLNQLAHEQAGYVGSLSTTSLWRCWHTQALSASSHELGVPAHRWHPITLPASLHTIDIPSFTLMAFLHWHPFENRGRLLPVGSTLTGRLYLSHCWHRLMTPSMPFHCWLTLTLPWRWALHTYRQAASRTMHTKHSFQALREQLRHLQSILKQAAIPDAEGDWVWHRLRASCDICCLLPRNMD